MRKYVLTDADVYTDTGVKLTRVKATRRFGDVSAGDIGGFISAESNLSHDGNCWVCCT